MLPSNLSRARWQWQPTRTSHDPSPPITLESGNSYSDTISISRLESFLDNSLYGIRTLLDISEREFIFEGNLATMLAGASVSERDSLSESAQGSLGASVTLLDKSGFSNEIQNSIGKQVSINQQTGFNNSTTLGAFSVIDLADRLASLHGVNIGVLSALAVSAIQRFVASAALSVFPTILISDRLFIALESSISTNDVLVILQTLSESLGISASAQLTAFAALPISEKNGILNEVFQIQNAGLGLNAVYSIVTISGIETIILLGFILASDWSKYSASNSDRMKMVTTSDFIKNNLNTSENSKDIGNSNFGKNSLEVSDE